MNTPDETAALNTFSGELARERKDGTPEARKQPSASRSADEIERRDYATIYEAKFDRMVGQLCRMGIDRNRAVDLMQDAWMNCWEKRHQLRDSSCLSGWVMISAINRACSLARRNRWLVQWPVNYQPAIASEINEGAIDLGRAVGQLTERQKQVLELILEGMSGQEIASTLNTTLDAVYTLSARARHALRKLLGASQSSVSSGQDGKEIRARRA